ncbi:MAG TPA: hypothetical protein VH087_18745 [Thermoanaerobaculia bacterium]|nr:hypothetical protein [Thermoanaerobaculia bacterium]
MTIVLALLVFRGKSLARYLAFTAAMYALAWLLYSARCTVHCAQGFDVPFAIVTLIVLELAAFSVALANAKEVRWSATRAMAVTAIVYAFVVAAQMRQAPDGDEPFYLLITESLVKDHDRDLANQYRDLAHSATRRTDLQPQIGDIHGPHGEQYSRLEPFLPIVMIPGYKLGGLPGALATLALLGVLLVRQTIRLLEDEGIDDATIRALFPFFAFGPPIVFYAARIWPELPGALAFVEAVRGVRQRRIKRAIPAMLLLGLFKVRFVLIDLFLVIQWPSRKRSTHLVLAALIPLLLLAIITGSALNGHSLKELHAPSIIQYEVGFFGLFLDGMSGLLFQAPFYLLGVFALLYWREMPASFRIGIIGSLPYIVSLVPRAEWHGGWSPPLRYITVFMPVLFLGAAAMWRRCRPVAFVVPAAIWTIGLTIHGMAFPWRLFHIESGENYAGEWLSKLYHADFSRLFPSFIRINQAALVASIAFVVALLLFRFVRVPQVLIAPLLAIAMLAGFRYALQPANVIELEDAHVIHNGGELYPPLYTVERFFHRSGWTLRAGESMSFLARAGTSRLEYASGSTARIELDGREYKLPGTRQEHLSETVYLTHTGRVTLRCLDGSVSFDRMRHE